MTLIKLHNNFRLVLICATLLPSSSVFAEALEYQLDGHIKGRFIAQAFPDNSIFNELTGSSSLNLNSDLRLNFKADTGPWRFDADYQLFALYGDQIEYTRDLPPLSELLGDRLINDDRRLFDLTSVIEDKGKFAALQRLDRLALTYSGEKTVVKVGRQSLSWGNGMFFSPMDIINPFDPTTIDTEYKTGDDMLYLQYLLDNGSDIQSAAVARRNPVTGDVESNQASYAVKYHGFLDQNEYDILLAQSYDDLSLGLGGNRSIGGAIWQADLLVTETDLATNAQFVTNISYSWILGDHNMSGLLEYYYNGFGQKNGQYDPADLAQNPDLLKKLSRGEVFTLGQHYLAAAVTIEMSPLWTLTPNIFANLEDHSALLQIQSQNSLGDNFTFLGSLNIPIGPDGSEYGGIGAGQEGQYFSTSLGVFAQLAWYF